MTHDPDRLLLGMPRRVLVEISLIAISALLFGAAIFYYYNGEQRAEAGEDQALEQKQVVTDQRDENAAVATAAIAPILEDCRGISNKTDEQRLACGNLLRAQEVIEENATVQTVAGAPGADGVDGEAGADGEDGARGPRGPRGARGVEGAAGSDGEEGAAGTAGATGEQGPAGPAGPAGPKGDRGEDGAGTPGEDGLDALPFTFAFTVPGDLTSPDRTYRVTCSLDGCAVQRTEE